MLVSMSSGGPVGVAEGAPANRPDHVGVALRVAAAGTDADRGRWSSPAAVPRRWRGWSAARPRWACTARWPARRPDRRTTGTRGAARRPRAAGPAWCRGRRGPRRSRPRPARPRRRRGRGATKPAPTPTMSAIASSAPTSWKCDVAAGRSRARVASAHGEPLEDPRGEARGPPRRGRPPRAGSRMSRQVRWVVESATSTWQRVAAKPLRVTCSTWSVTGSGDDRVDGGLQHLDGYAGAEQRAEQHVAAGAGGGVDPDRHGDPGARRCRATRAANTPGAVAVVDVDHGHPGRAGVEHRQQRGQPAEGRAVPDAVGTATSGTPVRPPTTDGQRALHAGDDDEAVGGGEPVADVEQPVQAGDADVVDLLAPRRRGPAR